MRRTAALMLVALAMCSGDACAQISFVDVASAVGVDHTAQSGVSFPVLPSSLLQTTMGYGGAVGDYDDDGDLDLYLVGGSGFPNRLFRNDLDLGSPGFTDVTDSSGSGLADAGFSRLAHFADLDNDGLVDLLVISDHDPPAGAIASSRLFRNMGDGTFEDVTDGSGVNTFGYLRCGASLSDYNGDGLLDIYVAAWTLEAGSGSASYGYEGVPFSNKFFENTGAMTFVERTLELGLGFLAKDSFTSIFTDFDGNLEPDLYVAIDHASDAFFSCSGGAFTDTTLSVGATHVGNDMGVACADFDDDGDLDLYTTNITDSVIQPCNAGTTQGNALYVNQLAQAGSLSFVDDATNRGVFDTAWGWGVEWIDFENDGDLDLVAATGFKQWLAATVGTGCGLYATPTYSFVNDGTGSFSRITGIGMDAPDDSRGLVVFDYDRDGDQDVLITNIDEPVRLYENTTANSGNWLTVDVRQRASLNRFGIGVRIDASIGGVWKRRDILAGESYVVGTPAEVHFGLASHTSAAILRVYWTDGTTTTIEDVDANQLLRIEQPAFPCDRDFSGDATVLDLLAFLPPWFEGTPSADFDASDLTDINDLLAFLSCWFDRL